MQATLVIASTSVCMVYWTETDIRVNKNSIIMIPLITSFEVTVPLTL